MIIERYSKEEEQIRNLLVSSLKEDENAIANVLGLEVKEVFRLAYMNTPIPVEVGQKVIAYSTEIAPVTDTQNDTIDSKPDGSDTVLSYDEYINCLWMLLMMSKQENELLRERLEIKERTLNTLLG